MVLHPSDSGYATASLLWLDGKGHPTTSQTTIPMIVDTVTTTTAQFTQPALDGTVSVAVTDVSWMLVGESLTVAGGSYTVIAISDPTDVVLEYKGGGSTTVGAGSLVTDASAKPVYVDGEGDKVVRPGRRESAPERRLLRLRPVERHRRWLDELGDRLVGGWQSGSFILNSERQAAAPDDLADADRASCPGSPTR